MGIVYFKDRFMDEGGCHISPHDRSFRFGDGIFETMLVAEGRIYDMQGHMARLEAGLKHYRIDLDTQNLPALCRELVQCNALRQGFIRIVVSRGADEGGGTYKIQSSKPYLLLLAMEKPYPAFKEITLWCSTIPAIFGSPAKTNSAMHYVLAMQEAVEQGCDNAILLDENGYVCETASGNLFWINNDVLYTPSVDLALVPGTMRAKVLALWDGSREEGHFPLDTLLAADEVFMSNTGVIIAPVVGIKPMAVTRASGPRTGDLRRRLDEDIRGK